MWYNSSMVKIIYWMLAGLLVGGVAHASTQEASKTPSQMVFVMGPNSSTAQAVDQSKKEEPKPAPKPTAEQIAAAIAKERVAAEMAAKAAAEAAAKAEAEKKRLEDKADEAVRVKAISTRSFVLRNVNAVEVAESLNNTWGGATASDLMGNWKIGKVAQAFPDANVILITAPNFIMDACEKIIADIDSLPQQVAIEVRFLELSNNAAHKFGIDWQMLDGMKGSLSLDAGLHERKMDGVSSYTENTKNGSFTIGNGLDKSTANLSYVNGTIGMSELSVVLRALESEGDARVFSNPKVIVSSGKTAVVDMTTKYPNVRIVANRTTNSGDYSSLNLDMSLATIPGQDKMMFANEAFFSWGITLDVTPRVSTNGLINVEIVPTISSQTDWVTAGSQSEDAEEGNYSSKYPVLDVQRLITEFHMASGTTAVIGGLSRTIETQKDNGIPYLRRIWGIGPWLFGSKMRVKEQKDIIVFVTVELVEDNAIDKDAGLPKNAVLGRQYVHDIRREPGDRKRLKTEGLGSLDMRDLEDQYNDPRWTNRVHRMSIPLLYPNGKPDGSSTNEVSNIFSRIFNRT